MGTPNSTKNPLQFRVADLVRSQEPEEQAQVVRCQKLLDDTVAKLKPILKYVAREYSVRGTTGPHGPWLRMIEITRLSTTDHRDRTMFLDTNGKFVYAILIVGWNISNELEDVAYEADNPTLWHHAMFGDIINGLAKVLQGVEANRQAHLEAIKLRSSALTAMSAIINGNGIEY